MGPPGGFRGPPMVDAVPAQSAVAAAAQTRRGLRAPRCMVVRLVRSEEVMRFMFDLPAPRWRGMSRATGGPTRASNRARDLLSPEGGGSLSWGRENLEVQKPCWRSRG